MTKDNTPYWRCYTCEARLPLRHLIQIRPSTRDDTKPDMSFSICRMCRLAYEALNFTEDQIFIDLSEHSLIKLAQGSINEREDNKRQSKKPITLEELAEFSYWLRKNKPDMVFKTLLEGN